MSEKQKSSFVYKLARSGAISLGIVYAMIGVVAILSLLRLKEGGASEASILNMLDSIPLGRVFIVLIFLGLLSFIFWKFYNAIVDPYGYGKNYKGLAQRIAIAAGGMAYGMIAYSAVEAFLGLSTDTHGQPYEQRLMVAKIFTWWAGEWLTGLVGILVGITGLAQFVYVIKRGYREKLQVHKLSKYKIRWIDFLAWMGHFARGIILIIVGYFLIKASIRSDPSEVVNTDKAFNFLGENVNHVAFVLVAVGTICYGLYLFVLSRYFDFEDDF